MVWLWVVAVVWPVVAVAVGLLIGRMIWRRDQQKPGAK